MSDEPRVQLRIIIQAETDEVLDTKYTLEQWNALTDQERDAETTDLFGLALSNADTGGITVITPGAKEV